MPKKPLTDRFVAGIKPTEGIPQQDYFDTGYSGLALRVGHRDKVFTYHYRAGGKLHRMRLGRYPEMTLAEARDAWLNARKALATGDMQIVRQRTISTIESVIAEWLEAWKRGKAENTVKAVRSQVSTYVLPAWGPRNVADITKRDALALLDGITGRGAIVQARRVYATLASFFKWCLKRDIITADPMAAIERKDLGAEKSRDRVLSDEELGKFGSGFGIDLPVQSNNRAKG